jgi:hypothetical protein
MFGLSLGKTPAGEDALLVDGHPVPVSLLAVGAAGIGTILVLRARATGSNVVAVGSPAPSSTAAAAPTASTFPSNLDLSGVAAAETADAQAIAQLSNEFAALQSTSPSTKPTQTHPRTKPPAPPRTPLPPLGRNRPSPPPKKPNGRGGGSDVAGAGVQLRAVSLEEARAAIPNGTIVFAQDEQGTFVRFDGTIAAPGAPLYAVTPATTDLTSSTAPFAPPPGPAAPGPRKLTRVTWTLGGSGSAGAHNAPPVGPLPASSRGHVHELGGAGDLVDAAIAAPALPAPISTADNRPLARKPLVPSVPIG